MQNLTFTRIDSTSGDLGGDEIVLNNPAKLFSKNVSESYAIMVESGEYALTGFDIKVAKSQNDISHIRAQKADLYENGRPTGAFFC